MNLRSEIPPLLICLLCAFVSFTAIRLLDKRQENRKRQNPYYPYKIVVLDSCEYIRIKGSIFSSDKLIHKETCDHSKHKD